MDNPFLRTEATNLQTGLRFDAGLRAHMQSVFRYMGGGLAVTGILAYIVGSSPELMSLIFRSWIGWLVIFSPLALTLYLNVRFAKMSYAGVQGAFWLFCALMGLSMGGLFMAYTHESIAQVFFITASTFGAMSLWGYTTSKDLTSFGGFMMMGIMGLFIALLVNMFLQSAAMGWVMSVIGVVVFTGLTAYDVQRIKQTYAEGYGSEQNGKLAVMNALGLYLNFINAFQFLLELMGNRR